MRQTFVSATASSHWPPPLHLVLERPFGGPLPAPKQTFEEDTWPARRSRRSSGREVDERSSRRSIKARRGEAKSITSHLMPTSSLA